MTFLFRLVPRGVSPLNCTCKMVLQDHNQLASLNGIQYKSRQLDAGLVTVLSEWRFR